MIKYLIISFIAGLTAGVILTNYLKEDKIKVSRTENTMPPETTYTNVVIYKKGKGEIRTDTVIISNDTVDVQVAAKTDYDEESNFKAELSYNIKDNTWDNKYSFDKREISKTKLITEVIKTENKIIKYFGEVGAGINFYQPDRKYEYTLGAGVEVRFSRMIISVYGNTAMYNTENEIKVYPQLRGKLRWEF